MELKLKQFVDVHFSYIVCAWWHHSKLKNWAIICVDTTNDDELGCFGFLPFFGFVLFDVVYARLLGC